MYSSYKFEQECRNKAKVLAEHIKAMLKVGAANAIDKETIRINLEHFCPHKFLDDYIINDALRSLYGTIVKTGNRGTYYLREASEEPNVK